MPLLPKSKMPVTLNVDAACPAVVSRSLSPTTAPRSFASSVPMMMSSGPTFCRPATIFSCSAITSKYESVSIPVIVTDLVASPRTAKPGPATIGVTPVTSAICATWARTFCHWSTERNCCERGWICAAMPADSFSRSGRATWSGGRMVIGAW